MYKVSEFFDAFRSFAGMGFLGADTMFAKKLAKSDLLVDIKDEEILVMLTGAPHGAGFLDIFILVSTEKHFIYGVGVSGIGGLKSVEVYKLEDETAIREILQRQKQLNYLSNPLINKCYDFKKNVKLPADTKVFEAKVFEYYKNDPTIIEPDNETAADVNEPKNLENNLENNMVVNKCPHCNEILPDGTAICFYCKKSLSYKKCPYCAEEIKAEAIKCRFCHSMLN